MSVLVKHSLINSLGDEVSLMNLGARITSIKINMSGGQRELVLGYMNDHDYLDDQYYLGCSVGRVANRIGGAKYKYLGADIVLNANEGFNQLHGGENGFDKQFWELDPKSCNKRAIFILKSLDGDQGFPGNLTIFATYTWSDNRELKVAYTGFTDKATPVSITNHSYFNLNATDSDELEHFLSIKSNSITDFNDDLTANGEIVHIKGTDLDLNKITSVSNLIKSKSDYIKRANGADFNYVLTSDQKCARLLSASEDLAMDVSTNYPGLQLYLGQHLGTPFTSGAGMCLEPQFHPGSPNFKHFPDCVLVPGQKFDHYILYVFKENFC